MRLSIFLILAYLFYCTISSCSKTHHHTATDKKITLQTHLQAGQRYYLSNSNITNTTINGDSKDINKTSKLFMGLTYEVLKDSADIFTIKLTYDSLHSYTKNNDEEMDIDAANGAASINPVEKLFGILKGKSLLITLNNRGQVLGVIGIKELSDTLIATMGQQDIDTKKQVREQLDNILGDGFVKGNIAAVSAQSPDSAVYVGDSWIKTTDEPNVLGLKAVTSYTLDKVDDNMATVTGESTITVSDTTINLMGLDVAVNLTGKGDKKYKVNTTTGFLVNDVEDMEVSGTIEVRGRQVPIKITSKKEITVRKM